MFEGSEWYQFGPKWTWVTLLIIKDQFGIIQNLHMSPIPQTSFLVGTFFAASYSKTALTQKIDFKHGNFNFWRATNAMLISRGVIMKNN